MKEQLSRYAELLVKHGLNIQEGQILNISAETCHRDFCLMISEAAYKAGAKLVQVELTDPRQLLARLEHAEENTLDFVPEYLGLKYKNLVDSTSANLKLVGSEFPDALESADPKKINKVRISRYKSLKYFYDEGIGKSKVHWTVAAAATPQWGQKIFPNLAPEAAEQRLWEELLKVVRADKPDCLEVWEQHNSKLHHRASTLSNLGLESIHFEGPETDLTVGLSELAIFKGGSDTSPLGVDFEPNIPTEEVFTTPDFRKTSGKVKTTRPFLINGVLIENLNVVFEEGEIKSFTASKGKETFAEYIESDPGAKRLGEVALVGIDSPIFKSGIIFQEILLDENAACHIAIGSAYKFCLKNGPTLSEQELQDVGCNESSAHTDMMISDENTNVSGITHSGEKVVLLKNGTWQI